MTRIRCAISAMALLVAATASAQNTVDELVAALAGDNAEARQQAFENAGKFGAEAIVPVAALLDSENTATVRAAKIALEKIVGPACVDAAAHKAVREVWSESKEFSSLGEARVVFGTLLEVPVRDFVARMTLSPALLEAALKVKNREWLLWLLSYAGGPEALPGLLDILDTKPESFDAALLAIQSIGASGMSANNFDLIPALISRMQTREGRERIALINTLGAIGDPKATPALLEITNQHAAARDAAIAALGRIGDPQAADALWAVYRDTGSRAAADAYLKVIEHMKPKDAAKAYRTLLEVSDDSNVACAALYGLGKTGASRKSVRVLCEKLEAGRADVYGAAKNALIGLQGWQAGHALAKLAREGGPSAKCAALEILVARDAKKARSRLDRALEDESPEVRVEALRLLGAEPDPKYKGTFLDAAQTGSAEARPLALQGYLKLAARTLSSGDTNAALLMYHTALNIAERDQERITALEGLTTIANPGTLEYLYGSIARETMRIPADACVLAIADKLQKTDAETAKEAYNLVLSRTQDRDQGNRAAAGLRALGAEEDIAARGGFITRWELIGPFPKESFASVYPPETEYKPDAAYPGADGRQVGWQPWQVEDAMGVVDLDKILSPKERLIAYARAEIVVENTQDIILRMGSDDGIVVWVNTEKVHENDASRCLIVDEDAKPATLLAGKNVVLVKIVQGSGDWSFCVRLVDRSGRPLRFKN